MWKDAYLESRVLAADPVELIQILYDHTMTMVKDARRNLAAGDIAARGRSISRAIAALDELDTSLDRKSGGSISRNLAELYQYMRTKLLEGNIKQQDAPLAEVESLLKTLSDGWTAMRKTSQTAPAMEAKPVAEAWGGKFTAIPEADAVSRAWSA